MAQPILTAIFGFASRPTDRAQKRGRVIDVLWKDMSQAARADFTLRHCNELWAALDEITLPVAAE
jgi:hypothetical protein